MKRAAALLLALSATSGAVSEASDLAGPVSPGHPERVSLTAGPCPTFNWSGAAEATGYEIVVYSLEGAGRDLQPVFRRSFRGSTTGWTPSLPGCLRSGSRYAWAVRPLSDGAPGTWSRPHLFQIADLPSRTELTEALAIVSRYMAEEGQPLAGSRTTAAPTPKTGTSDSAAPSAESSRQAPLPASAATALTVDGNIDARSFTGDGSGLTAVDADTVDGHDLRAVGTINMNDNPVDWTKLKNVPNGLADGVDADSGGTITSVGAGTGLTGGGNTGGVTLHADTTFLQRRIGSSCPAGQSIRAVSEQGGVTCEVDDGTTYIGAAPVQVVGSTISLDGTVARKNSAAGDQAFDAGTLYLDYANNRVGVGLTNPDEELDVIGDVEATGHFRYSADRTFHQFIAASGFQPGFDDVDTLRLAENVLYPTAEGNQRALAPVHLPAGADVTEVRCFYYDNSTAGGFDQVKFELQSRPLGATGGTFIATAIVVPAVPVSPNVLAFADTSVSGSGDPVDYSSYAYSLAIQLNLASGSTPGPDIGFYGCRISYTLGHVSH